MKRCCCCKRLLPESEFHHNKANKDGLNTICKICAYYFKKGMSAKRVRKELETKLPKRMTALDGLRISVQSYAKKGEHIYNILETRNSKYLGFDDKEQFFIKLEELLERGI